MDPSTPPNDNKDSNWNFPPDIEFPVDARVIVKFYKVVETDDDDGKTVQTKYLNTKVIKVKLSKLPNINNLSKEENWKAKEVCQEHKALPQSSTRTFTSKFKAETLPLLAYLTANVEA